MTKGAVRLVGVLAMAGLLAAWGTPGSAEVKPGSEQGLGLTGADVPPLLKAVEADPYHLPAPLNCAGVAGELAALDDLLGPDIDTQPSDEKSGLGSKSANLARGLVPYGGVMRLVTGANGKDKAFQKALVAGYARRGFLRGLQAAKSCHVQPPTPRPPAAPGD